MSFSPVSNDDHIHGIMLTTFWTRANSNIFGACCQFPGSNTRCWWENHESETTLAGGSFRVLIKCQALGEGLPVSSPAIQSSVKQLWQHTTNPNNRGITDLDPTTQMDDMDMKYLPEDTCWVLTHFRISQCFKKTLANSNVNYYQAYHLNDS